MNSAVAITTYAPSNVDFYPERLKHTLDSLKSTYNGHIIIVDDGSTNLEHIRYLQLCGCKVIFKKSNGGIARAKNTCIRVMRDLNVDNGFLVDDDILFCPGWYEAYIEAHEKTGLNHFSWFHRAYGSYYYKEEIIGDFPVTRCQPLTNGVCLFITRG